MSGHAANNFKALFDSLFERVGRQSDALGVVSRMVSQLWVSDGTQQKGGLRGNIWLNFTGTDVFGKRKTALALTEVLYGNKKYLSHVNLSSEHVLVQPKKVFGYQISNGSDPRFRGKTIVDHIAEELRNTPFSVVLLENAHFADPVTQSRLLQAIKVGKFSDSYGREVSLNNRVLILTSSMEKLSKIPEARIERAKGWPLQLVVKSRRDDKNHQNAIILGPEKNSQHQFFLCKRKLTGQSMSLDLNLPAEISEEEDEANFEDTDHGCMDSWNKLKAVPQTASNTEPSDTDAYQACECKDTRSWLDELSGEGVVKTLVKVVFYPFDYDALAAKVLKLVHASFCKVIDSKCMLEIEPRALDQILAAAACSSDADKEIEDWIMQVLSQSFSEAQKKYQLRSHSIVMLTTCEGEALCADNQVVGVYLPAKVSVF